MNCNTMIRGLKERVWAMHPDYLSMLAFQASNEIKAFNIQATDGASPVKSGSVAILPIFGAITHRSSPVESFLMSMFGGNSYEHLTAKLETLKNDKEIKTLILDINSPGGSVQGLPEFAGRLYQARGNFRIIALANSLAASAAYWIASSAHEISVTPSGQVGSVGIMTEHVNKSALQEKLGIKTTIISSGKFKTELAADELSADAIASIQNQTDTFYEMFVNDIARGRNVTAEKVKNGFGQGRMALAQAALAEGMVDNIETMDQVIQRSASNSTGRVNASLLSALTQDVRTSANSKPTTKREFEKFLRESGFSANAANKITTSGFYPNKVDKAQANRELLQAISG